VTKGVGAVVGLAILLAAPVEAAQMQNVREYGANGDGRARDTSAVQRAVDAAEKAGGGVVYLPAGTYLCGTVHLKSRVTLSLDPGATILASPDDADFDPYEPLPFQSADDHETTYFHFSLLAGEGIHDVAIVGEGAIDGNRTKRGGPKTIAFKNCQQLTLRGVTLKNGPNYNVSFIGCDHVNVDGLTILNGYADGIDPDNCRYVRIANCFVDSLDDAIVLKASTALGRRASTEHVTVTNCILSTSANNLKLGTESYGHFRNIAITNCVCLPRSNRPPASGGINIATVDGGEIDRVVVSNIAMQDVRCPIFIRLGKRGRGQRTPEPGTLENVSITNLVATGATVTCSVTGLPGHSVRHISLDGINIEVRGGEPKGSGLDVPERPPDYPRPTIFGTLPAHGLYSRHVSDFTVKNFRVRWQQGDFRPASIFDDVADLRVDGFQAAPSGGEPAIWLNQARGVLVSGCQPPPGCQLFLRVGGAQTARVRLAGNDLPDGTKPVERSPEVPASAVTSAVAREKE
jgi:hypothetical protein